MKLMNPTGNSFILLLPNRMVIGSPINITCTKLINSSSHIIPVYISTKIWCSLIENNNIVIQSII